MSEITLKRANVLKRVDSEDMAKALEAQGFIRMTGKTLKIPAAQNDTDRLKKELADTKGQLQEAKKKIQTLEADLKGTKEQLEAAVEQNKLASKK